MNFHYGRMLTLKLQFFKINILKESFLKNPPILYDFSPYCDPHPSPMDHDVNLNLPYFKIFHANCSFYDLLVFQRKNFNKWFLSIYFNLKICPPNSWESRVKQTSINTTWECFHMFPPFLPYGFPKEDFKIFHYIILLYPRDHDLN